jgi:hypothetical protein
MFALLHPTLQQLHHAPQIGAGTVDFFPILNGEPLAIAFARARAGQEPPEVDELIVLLAPGQPCGPGLATIPNESLLQARPPAQAFATEADFRAHCIALRHARGRALPCLVSWGQRNRHFQPQVPHRAAPALALWDLFDADNTIVGAGLAAALGPASTVQHWVLFGEREFDKLRVRRRPTLPFSSLGSFLDDTAQRVTQWDTCPHAMDEVVHHPDLPWTLDGGGA